MNKEILLKYFIFLLKSVYSLIFSFSNTQLYMIKFSCFSFDPRTTRVRLIGRSRTDIQFISIHIYSKTSYIWAPSGLFQIAHLTEVPRISRFLLITCMNVFCKLRHKNYSYIFIINVVCPLTLSVSCSSHLIFSF